MHHKNLRSVALMTVCSFVCLLLGATLTFGQKASCKVGSLSFACPKGFQPMPLESEKNLALLFQKKYDLGLFVVTPESGFDEQKVMSDVTKTALAKFFP